MSTSSIVQAEVQRLLKETILPRLQRQFQDDLAAAKKGLGSPAQPVPTPPPAPLSKPHHEAVQEGVQRALKDTVLPRLREQFKVDLDSATRDVSSRLLRELYASEAESAREARLPNLAPGQEPPEVLLGLIRATSGPADLRNAKEMLIQSHSKGWQLHPDSAAAISECFPPIDAITVLGDVPRYGVSIPPLARLRVLRTILRNLVSGENPLGLESPALTRAHLGLFRLLAQERHVEDPLLVALLLHGYNKIGAAEFRTMTAVDGPGMPLSAFAGEWGRNPLTVEEGEEVMALVDSLDGKGQVTDLFISLPLLHVHRHRERLFALYRQCLPAGAGEQTRVAKSNGHVPWLSSLAVNRSATERAKAVGAGELLSLGRMRRLVRPAFNFHADDPVVLLLALLLARRLPPADAEAETARLLAERIDGPELQLAKGWRLVHEDDVRLGSARTLARRTIELGLAQLKDILGERTALWERLLQ